MITGEARMRISTLSLSVWLIKCSCEDLGFFSTPCKGETFDQGKGLCNKGASLFEYMSPRMFLPATGNDSFSNTLVPSSIQMSVVPPPTSTFNAFVALVAL